MDKESFQKIITQKDDAIEIKHSPKRKLLESFFFLVFLLIGSLAITFGIIFKDQSLFFRISLIIIGCVVSLIFLDSVISTFSNYIILNEKQLIYRTIFTKNDIYWKEIDSIELSKRKTRLKRHNLESRYILIEIKTIENDEFIIPLYRFQPQEAYDIVSIITSFYQRKTDKEDKNTVDSIEKMIISNEEIEKHIPPRVESFELEDS